MITYVVIYKARHGRTMYSLSKLRFSGSWQGPDGAIGVLGPILHPLYVNKVKRRQRTSPGSVDLGDRNIRGCWPLITPQGWSARDADRSGRRSSSHKRNDLKLRDGTGRDLVTPAVVFFAGMSTMVMSGMSGASDMFGVGTSDMSGGM